MICERCGTQSDNGARICPRCGAPLRAYTGTGGVSSLRQGRTHVPPPVYGSDKDRMPRQDRYAQDAGRPENRRGVNAQEKPRQEGRARKHQDTPRAVNRRGVNRALLLTILAGLMLVAAVAVFILAIKLPQGHLLLLRAAANNPERKEKIISLIGEKEAAVALWQIGQEQIDQGYIARCIDTYQEAYALDPEIDGLYGRLLSLADAYEAIGRLDEAEATYKQLYTDVEPENPLAYRYAIDIMMDQGRLFEATDLMLLAYNQTGEISFKSQREQRVPLTPTSSPQTGRYMETCSVSLSSPQGYDVYYLLNDSESELPENGILYESPITLGEGTHEIRAVCVSSELISDEVSLRYTVYFPVPSAPKSRVLTGEYDRPKRIHLYIEDPKISGDTPGQILTIYYTIDGTAPNSDSPIYTDEGFMLSAGKYTVRAVAVNQFGKVSNEYVGDYKINQRFENFFRDSSDQFKNFTVGKTTYSDFKSQYGAGREETIAADTLSGAALKVTYDWGEAYFTDVGQVLYSINTNYASMTGPRKTHVGMRLEEVTAAFRDMGQVANAKGNRSIYCASGTGYARYWKDSDTSAHLEYVYWRDDDATTMLIYYLNNGVVSRIDMTISGLLADWGIPCLTE